ncbi:MAG: LSm family protein [Candidatus Nanoarchaeia archaeon]|nr:LSm family protein [Candidatus Haiyanarchaeum thermophilum]MCW1302846.1 LSm family protein [Candidatus Haiyanarchaeum thermophilum]MCW1303526.1 LSm family protein [Candidatus Haiyanarchaeum thermophilum]MCW1306706.1 LSm family protein [Candidatus Haiyanarchaeum thermophilum]MCW1307338.1 LSm family protein [Candidatus Haiyanarchaeum thermophilum]
MEETLRPLDVLNSAKGTRVMVDLKNGKQLVGTLLAFDIHINIVLDDAEEIIENETKRKLGKIFVRGDTIISIAVK